MIEQDAQILFNRKVAGATFLMGLESRQIAEKALPGQFVMLRISKGMDPLLRRPFSVCGTRDGHILLILYRVVGKGTMIMADLKWGQSVSVLGPLGKGFDLSVQNDSCLLAAGGIGLAPMLFLSSRLERPHLFFAGFRTSSEVFSREVFEIAQKEVQVATDDGSLGRKALVTEMLEESIRRGSGTTVFSCGPLPMLKEVVRLSKSHGVSCQLSLEANMACGIGVCLGCALPAAAGTDAYLHVCQDGPVFMSSEIDWERI